MRGLVVTMLFTAARSVRMARAFTAQGAAQRVAVTGSPLFQLPRTGSVRMMAAAAAEDVQAAVAAQGAVVRKLKEEDGLTNADQAVKDAVAELMRLKALAEAEPAPAAAAPAEQDLEAAIAAQGAVVRKLKEEDGLTNGDQAVKDAVAELVRLKALAAPPPAAKAPPAPPAKKKQKKKGSPPPAPAAAADGAPSAAQLKALDALAARVGKSDDALIDSFVGAMSAHLDSLQKVKGGAAPAKAAAPKSGKADAAPKTDKVVETEYQVPSMEEIINVCKRRGIIFQSSEVYGGFAGFFDYGPLGVELRANIKKAWWQSMVHRRDDVVGLDSSIISSPQVWKASGHIDGFSDPMVDCKESNLRYRADQLFWARAEVDGELLGYVSLMETDDMQELAEQAAEKLKRKAKMQGTLSVTEVKDFTEATPEEQKLIPSPATGEAGSLTAPREFNLMFQTNVGAQVDGSSVAYLRPETAQGIFTNFKNVVATGRVKVPFGIAQVGKAFRNEITPRNFIFRSREFEQMEIEYFIPPDEDCWKAFHEQWLTDSENFLLSIGLRPELISRDVHPDHKLAHYARACTDLMFKFPHGTQELQGVAARGNYDLTQHATVSGKSMEYFDEERKEKYVPHVIEPSIGVDRLMLAVLTSAYAEDEVGGEKRSLLRFHPRLAPIKAAVLPLVKNKPEIMDKANAIYKKLQKRYFVTFDTSGQIGRRYRRMDEVGTPFCITVDFDTLEDDTVTLRDRDSTEQRRVTVPELLEYLEDQIDS